MQHSPLIIAGAGLAQSTPLYRLVITALVGLLVVLSVQISWLLLGRFQPPPAVLPMAVIASEKTDSAAQFSGLALFVAPRPAVVRPATTGIPETRLPLTVQGLWLAAQPALNQVAMAVQGKPGVYLAGDRLPLSGQVLVLAVEPGRILLRHNGRKEKLSLSGQRVVQPVPAATVAAAPTTPADAAPAAGTAASGNRALYLAQSAFARAVPDYRQRIIKDPLFLSRYLRLSPRRENGQLQGYRLQPGRDSALYQALQLQPDDLLISLDQQPVSNPGRLLALLPTLGQASQLTLGLLRAGQPVTYTLYL